MKFIKFFNKHWISILSLIFVGMFLLTNLEDKVSHDRLHEDLVGTKEKLKKLNEHAADLEKKYINQVILRNELERDWRLEKDSLKGRIKLLSNATYLIRERARKEDRSDLVYEGKTTKYVFNEIRFKDGPPIGYVMIFDDGKVVSKIYNHKINAKTAVSRDENTGKYNVITKADYVLRSGHLKDGGVNWFNKPYPLNIEGGTALIDPTEPKYNKKQFFLWSPKINGNINANHKGIYPGISTSIMGYGVSKNDLDWKFLQLGTQYKEDSFDLTLTPVLYRPFDNLIDNTYIGPGISLDKDGNYDYFIGISVGF